MTLRELGLSLANVQRVLDGQDTAAKVPAILRVPAGAGDRRNGAPRVLGRTYTSGDQRATVELAALRTEAARCPVMQSS